MDDKLIGLHSPVWITREHLDECLSELKTAAMMLRVGMDTPSALDRFAYTILKANGLTKQLGGEESTLSQ